MASTGTLINKVGLISRSTVSTEGQEEAHHAGFWYRNCKRFFSFYRFFFFFHDEWVTYTLHVEWHLNGCMCMSVYDLHCLEQDEKWRYLGCGVLLLLSAGPGHLSHPLSRWSRLDRLSPWELWPEESRQTKDWTRNYKRKGKNTEFISDRSGISFYFSRVYLMVPANSGLKA